MCYYDKVRPDDFARVVHLLFLKFCPSSGFLKIIENNLKFPELKFPELEFWGSGLLSSGNVKKNPRS
jgi:hypothetical protein